MKLKKKRHVITIPMELFKNSIAPVPIFRKAARKVMKDIKTHFTNKGEGWPVDYNFYVVEIFYEAFGHHLENYLLRELAKSKLPLQLSTSDKGKLLISKYIPKSGKIKRRKK